jgi:hypothetical protein
LVGVIELKVKTAPHVRFGGMTRQVELGVKILGCAGLHGAAWDGAIFAIIDFNSEVRIGQEVARVVGYKGAARRNASMDAGGEQDDGEVWDV